MAAPQPNQLPSQRPALAGLLLLLIGYAPTALALAGGASKCSACRAVAVSVAGGGWRLIWRAPQLAASGPAPCVAAAAVAMLHYCYCRTIFAADPSGCAATGLKAAAAACFLKNTLDPPPATATNHKQEELITRLDAEVPRNHLDMRHRLDKDGKRWGPVIDYKWVGRRVVGGARWGPGGHTACIQIARLTRLLAVHRWRLCLALPHLHAHTSALPQCRRRCPPLHPACLQPPTNRLPPN